MEAAKLDPWAFGYAFGIVEGLAMLLVGIAGRLGYMGEALRLYQSFFPGLSPSLMGILIGILEAAVLGFVVGYLLAALYNRFV